MSDVIVCKKCGGDHSKVSYCGSRATGEYLSRLRPAMTPKPPSPTKTTEPKMDKDFLDIAVAKLYDDLYDEVLCNFSLVSVYEGEFKDLLRHHMAGFLRAHWPDVQKLPWGA